MMLGSGCEVMDSRLLTVPRSVDGCFGAWYEEEEGQRAT